MKISDKIGDKKLQYDINTGGKVWPCNQSRMIE